MPITRAAPISISAPTKSLYGNTKKYVTPSLGINVRFSDQESAIQGFGQPFRTDPSEAFPKGEKINNGWGTASVGGAPPVNPWVNLSPRKETNSWIVKRDLNNVCGNQNWVGAAVVGGTKLSRRETVSWDGEQGGSVYHPHNRNDMTAYTSGNQGGMMEVTLACADRSLIDLTDFMAGYPEVYQDQTTPVTTSPSGGTFDDSLIVRGAGQVNGDYEFIFSDANNFELFVGGVSLGTGDISTEFAPLGSNGEIAMTIPITAWGGTFADTDSITFTTQTLGWVNSSGDLPVYEAAIQPFLFGYDGVLPNGDTLDLTEYFMEIRSTNIYRGGTIAAQITDPAEPKETQFHVVGACIVTDVNETKWILAVGSEVSTNGEVILKRQLGYAGELWEGWFPIHYFRAAKVSIQNMHGWRFNESGTKARCLYYVPINPINVFAATSQDIARLDIIEMEISIPDILNTGTFTAPTIINKWVRSEIYPERQILNNSPDRYLDVPELVIEYTGSQFIETNSGSVPGGSRTDPPCAPINWSQSSFSYDVPVARTAVTVSNINTPKIVPMSVDYEGDTPVYLMSEVTFTTVDYKSTWGVSGVSASGTVGTWGDGGDEDCVRETADSAMWNASNGAGAGIRGWKSTDQHRVFISGGTRDNLVLFDSGTNIRTFDDEVGVGEGNADTASFCIPFAADVRYGILVYGYGIINAKNYGGDLNCTGTETGIRSFHPVHGTKDILKFDQWNVVTKLNNLMTDPIWIEAGDYGVASNGSLWDIGYPYTPAHVLGAGGWDNHGTPGAGTINTHYVARTGFSTGALSRFNSAYDSGLRIPPSFGCTPHYFGNTVAYFHVNKLMFYIKASLNQKHPVAFCVNPYEDNDFVFSASYVKAPDSIGYAGGRFYVPHNIAPDWYQDDAINAEDTTRVFYGSRGDTLNMDYYTQPYANIESSYRIDTIGLV